MEGGGGVDADGDVVGVAVEPVGPEGQHHLGAEAAHLQDQALHHDVRVGVDEGTGVIVGLPALHSRVAIAPDVVAVQAQGANGTGQLDLADVSQRFAGGRAFLTDFALLAESGGEQAHVDAAAGVGSEGAAHGERLVVGVCKAGQQSMLGHFNLPPML